MKKVRATGSLFARMVLFPIVLSVFSITIFSHAEASSFSKVINYQGKLTDSSGVTVSDGSYNMEFKLYTASSGGSAIWTNTLIQNDRIAVTNGLFSVLLGATSTSLANVNFDQPLYMSINVGGTTNTASPTWDGEMTPRKQLSSSPSAFESDKVDGLDSTQFARTDATNTVATSSAQTLLTMIQYGAGEILNLFSGSTEVLTVTNGGLLGIGTSTPYSKLSVWGSGTGGSTKIFEITDSASSTKFYVDQSGLASTSALRVSNTSTFDGTVVLNGLIYTSASDKAISFSQLGVSNEDVTNLSWNYNTKNLTATYSSSTAITSLGSAYFAINSGSVGIGTTSPYAKLSVVGETVSSYFTATSTIASSTFANGLNITGGCFAIGGTCIGGGVNNTFTNLNVTNVANLNGGASTTNISVVSNFYAGGTATTTINSSGDLFVAGSTTLQNFTAVNSTTTNATSTSFYTSLLTSLNSIFTNATSTNIYSSSLVSVNATSTSFYTSLLTAVNSLFTNATTTNLNVSGTASSSNLTVSNTFTLGNLSGFLKAASGVVSTAVVSLTADVSGVLPVANGGTNASSLGSSMLLAFDGTSVVSSSTPTAANYLATSSIASRFPYASTTAISSTGSAYFATAGGSVGVGTTTPYSPLQAYGGTKPQFVLSDSNAGGDQKHWYASSTLGALSFGLVSDDLTALTEKMRVTDSGLFGLNIDAPTATMDIVQQNVDAGNAMAFRLLGGAHTNSTAGGEVLDVLYNLDRTVQFAQGDIGTQRAFLINPPTYSFTASSTITEAATMSINGPPVSGLRASTTNAYGLLINTGNVRASGAVPPDYAFGLLVGPPSGATNNFAAQFNGGVGINGTSSPNYALTVDGQTAFGTTTIVGGVNHLFAASGATNIYGEGGNWGFAVYSTDPGGTGDIAKFGTAGAAGVAENDLIVIKNSGRVGIGTTTPNTILQLSGATRPQLILSDTGGGSNAKHAYASSTAGAWSWGILTDSLATFTENLRLTTTGFLGIGTTSPSQALSVNGWALINGSLTTTNVTATGTLTVSGASTLTGLASLNGGASTTALSVSQTLMINGNATTTSTGDISAQGTLSILGSTTLQNFTAVNSTSTNATTTNSFYTAILRAVDSIFTNATTTNLHVSGMSYAGGNATTTSAGNISTNGTFTQTPVARTSGAGALFSFTGAADTSLTASTEAPDIQFNLARTKQHAAGNITLERDVLINAATHSFSAFTTGLTTDLVTLGITGAPLAGTNASTTNAHTIYLGASALNASTTNSYGLTVNANTGATNNYAAQFLGGNVGIGTTSPYAKLSVVGETVSSYFTATSTTATSTFIKLLATNATTTSLAISDMTSGSVLFAGTSGQVMQNNTGFLFDNATSRLNVGINSDVFSVATMNIRLDSAAFANLVDATPTLAIQNQSADINTGSTLSYYGFDTSSSIEVAKISSKLTAAAGVGSMTADLLFGTSLNSAISEGMRLTSAGRLGVGTTSPGSLFSVQGNGLISGNLNLANLTATGTITATNASTTNVGSSGSSYFATSGGNVGIGTTGPESPLHVAGSSVGGAITAIIDNTAASTLNNEARLRFLTDGGASATVGGATIAAINTLAGDGSNALYFSTYTGAALTEKLRITSAGNVGIGTTTPAQKLDVTGAGPTQLRLESAGAGQGRGIQLTDASGSGTYNWYIGAQNNVGNAIEFTPSTATDGLTFSTPIAVLTQTGRLGIGTTTPGVLSSAVLLGASPKYLTVTGDTSAGIVELGRNIDTEDATIGAVSFYNFGNDSASTTVALIAATKTGVMPNSGGALRFITKPSEGDIDLLNPAMSILHSGYVGVATTSPWQVFSVQGGVALNGLATGAGNGALCLSTGGLVSYQDAASCTVSSQRFKNSIQTLSAESGLAEIMAMRPVSFRYNEGAGDNGRAEQVGFIAEEVNLIDPRLVVFEGTSTVPYSVQYQQVTAILTKAVQELNLNLESLASSTAPLMQTSEAGESEKTFLGRFFDRMIAWFADAANGIGDFFANRVRTKTLCLGDSANGETCITKGDLDRLIQNNNAASIQSAQSGGSSSSEQDLAGDGSGDTPASLADKEAPVIELIGNATSTLNVGDSFVDPGATVTDNVDHNLGVQVTGGVDTSKAGEYIIYYDATDSASNKAEQKSRVVTVVGPVAQEAVQEEPVITEPPIIETISDSIEETSGSTAESPELESTNAATVNEE